MDNKLKDLLTKQDDAWLEYKEAQRNILLKLKRDNKSVNIVANGIIQPCSYIDQVTDNRVYFAIKNDPPPYSKSKIRVSYLSDIMDIRWSLYEGSEDTIQVTIDGNWIPPMI